MLRIRAGVSGILFLARVATNTMAAPFISRHPSLEDYWRSIILFGRNVACYKFALAKSLMVLQPKHGDLIKLEDLAVPFAENIAGHLNIADKQATSTSSKFLDACRAFNQQKISKSDLIDQATKLGFNNVIDAFHIVGAGETPVRFFIDERPTNGGIRLTDEFGRLFSGSQQGNLVEEVEARWSLVEAAWELGISRNVVSVSHDVESGTFYTTNYSLRRKTVTSARPALNGYQKGQCFYCYDEIILDGAGSQQPEVDHFFPHTLKQHGFGPLIDGIWNLVLACQECNRGVGGKSASVPSLKLLERISRRNEFLIGSQHPLRETLMQQTGANEPLRRAFLNDYHAKAWALLIHTWEPAQKREGFF